MLLLCVFVASDVGCVCVVGVVVFVAGVYVCCCCRRCVLLFVVACCLLLFGCCCVASVFASCVR